MKYVVLIISIIILIGLFFYTTNNNLISEYADKPTQKDKEIIIIPVTVHLLIDEQDFYTSTLNENQVQILIANTNIIWQNADITYYLDDVLITHENTNSIANALTGNAQELTQNTNYNTHTINIYFAKSLNGINGLTLINYNVILISDYSTVGTSRTIAHELGHILSLKHVNDKESLMLQGGLGKILTIEEIVQARETALTL